MTTLAQKAEPACPQVISGKYRDNGQSALSSKNAIGCSIKFQYSKKPSTGKVENTAGRMIARWLFKSDNLFNTR